MYNKQLYNMQHAIQYIVRPQNDLEWTLITISFCNGKFNIQLVREVLIKKFSVDVLLLQ